MVLGPTQIAAQVAGNNTLYKKMSAGTDALLSGNEGNDLLSMDNDNILRLSTGAMDISKATSYQGRSEIVASDFERAGNQLNALQKVVVELQAALAMDDGDTAKNTTLTLAAEKLLNNVATTLVTSGRNDKNLFAGIVDVNNIKTATTNYDSVNNITSAGFMTDPSVDDVVVLREGDSTNIALKPEGLKDLIAAAQEIKRLATASAAVPAAVTTVLSNGGTALDSMIVNVKTIYDKASRSVEEQGEKIGSVRDALQHHMGVDEGVMAKELSDLRNTAQLLQAIQMMINGFESKLADILMRG
jgi:hypothetical protein